MQAFFTLSLYIITIQTINLFHVCLDKTFHLLQFTTIKFSFLVPPPKFYVRVNPIQVIFDVDSCLWLNSFALNLHQSLLSAKANEASPSFTYIDVKIEAILPRVC